MRPALVLRAKHAYQPMIQFLGQRKNLPKAPHAPAPHPAAPDSVKADFQSFLSKLQSQSGGADSPSSNPKGQSLDSSARGEVLPSGNGGSGSSSSQGVSDKTQGPIASKPADYDNFWEAPGYLWQLPEVGDREAEAILRELQTAPHEALLPWQSLRLTYFYHPSRKLMIRAEAPPTFVRALSHLQ